MPAITNTDLNNAKLDVDHIAAIATSDFLTATDRLGNTKSTIKGVLASIPETGFIGFENLAALSADLNHKEGIVAVVTNDSLLTNNSTYRKVGSTGTGSWVKTNLNMAAYLDAKKIIDGNGVTPDTAFSFAGEDGFDLGVAITATGEVKAKSFSTDSLKINETSEEGLYIIGEDNFILQAFDSKTQETLNKTEVAKTGVQKRRDINHVIVYGQSLSRGAYAKPIISATQPYSNVTLASGVLPDYYSSVYNPSSFIPLVEADYLSSEGESPTSGLCNGMTRRVVAEGESDSNIVFCGSSLGLGGQTIDSLSPDGSSQRYSSLVQVVKDTALLSASLNKSYGVWCYYWLQGEADYTGSSTNQESGQYIEQMLYLFNKMTTDIINITGQEYRPYIFTYQTAAHRYYSKDHFKIALAQWRASRMNEDVVMTVPIYMMPVGSDNIHLTAEGSWLAGEYASRAAHYTMYKRSGKWRPLEPISVNWTSTYIDIKFHVPCGPMVLDTTLCTQAVDQGFGIRSSVNAIENIISDVSVVSSDTVRITLSSPASTGSKLTYALGRPGDDNVSGPVAGARGNLRDSQGLYDVVTSPSGIVHALHNPCVMFEYSRANGF